MVAQAQLGDAPREALIGASRPTAGTAECEWVLLAYRLPRVPSTPRSTVWRQLKRLGVVQLGDGVVALPADARTREALEWIAEEVIDSAGEATIWIARPADVAGRAALAERMSSAVDGEYEQFLAEVREASSEGSGRARAVARLRRELRRIEARDFFRASRREDARRALEALAGAEAAAAAAKEMG